MEGLGTFDVTPCYSDFDNDFVLFWDGDRHVVD
jgi:hypothetical protein